MHIIHQFEKCNTKCNMKFYYVVLFILSVTIADDILVTTPKGCLKGRIRQSVRYKVKYCEFLGIPYAFPPVGILRFKGPQEHPGWNGVRDAQSHGSTCYAQAPNISSNVVQSEDCLFLNIYVPNNCLCQQGLPVMVFLHGGAFVFGSGDKSLYGPDYWMEYGVIFVTLNYRLGPLGFLSLHIPEAPGNIGLKDQACALRWIQQNIHAFGGDRRQVTIFGQSAGAASVALLQSTDYTNGLFSKTILQSGVPTMIWSFCYPDQAIQRAYRLGQLVGCNITDQSTIGRRSLYQCLLERPADVLSYHQTQVATCEDYKNAAYYMFIPTIEPDHPGAFITRSPIDIYISGMSRKLPTIIGSIQREGLVYGPDYEKIANCGLNFTDYIPNDLKACLTVSQLREVEDCIQQFYYYGEDINNATKEYYYNVMTEYAFLLDIKRVIYLLAQQSPYPIYNYLFTYNSSCSDYYPDGPGHNDELIFMMNPDNKSCPLNEYSKDSTPQLTVNRLLKMWTDFAKYGNPTPVVDSTLITTHWSPFSLSSHFYLDIGGTLSLKQGLGRERMKFWNDLYCKCRKRFVPFPE